jgi:hypothetical protein
MGVSEKWSSLTLVFIVLDHKVVVILIGGNATNKEAG